MKIRMIKSYGGCANGAVWLEVDNEYDTSSLDEETVQTVLSSGRAIPVTQEIETASVAAPEVRKRRTRVKKEA